MNPPSLELLYACRWFNGVAPEELQQLLAGAELKQYPAGAYLHAAGARPEGVYGVLSGSFKISVTNRDGLEATVTVVNSGGWLGETALFEGEPYLANCYALRPGQVLFVPKQPLLALCDRWPVVYRNLLQDACTKLKQACWVSLQNKLQTPELRLAHRLLILPELANPSLDNGWVELTDRLPHELLAQMVGLSRPRVSQAMKTLEQAGILKGGHGTLSIHPLRLSLFCKETGSDIQ